MWLIARRSFTEGWLRLAATMLAALLSIGLIAGSLQFTLRAQEAVSGSDASEYARADVLAFAQQWRREATSGVIIDVPSSGPTAHAAADSMREVHSILNASGVPGKAVYVRGYRPPPSALASIKIRYTKLTAEAGPCGQWPHDIGPSMDGSDFSNRPYWNLGCATQRNMAAMVANPADLVQPRGESPAYEPRRSVAIDKYRTGTSPAGAYADYDKGKISDLGK